MIDYQTSSVDSAVETLLSANGVAVRIGNRQVLPAMDLAVCRGETVAVVGPSGSGKTTLLACLAGLRRPTSGSVHALGLNLSAMGGMKRARFRLANIGFVYQHADLLPELTPLENVMLPSLLAGRSAGDAARDAEGLIAELGVATDAATPDLSGGEAQRLALARALVTTPSILLADEPTGSLDRASRDAVLELMLSQVAQRGMAAVVVTHDQDVAARTDRIIALPHVAVES